MEDMKMTEDTPRDVSRRNFIKGVDCGRGGGVLGQLSVPHDAAARAAAVGAGQRRAADHAERERAGPARRRDEAGNAGDDAALQAGADGHQAGMRPRGMRRVHGAGRRCAALFVLDADALGARQEDRDDRRAGGGRRDAASGAAGRGRRAGVPVRVLHAGLRDGDGRVSEDESEPDAAGAGARGLGQSVPLPGLRQDPHRADARR